MITFLQGRDPGLAHRIGSRTFCPEGPGSAALQVQADLLTHAYGELALPERAKLLAARFLINLVEVIMLTIDRDFVP